ncbi:hypothetical protein BBJ28_00018751 [Nothophytophthora sp. Chile5]|nr:hypothetical protein BBJ28_00018751 [Nothophytophthora sp. Chile5]
MHICAWRNRIAAAEFLLDQGADIALRDEVSGKAKEAVGGGRKCPRLTFTLWVGDSGQTGMTALQMDVLRVCLEKMRHTPLLRSRHIDVQSPVATGDTALLMAIEHGLVKQVEKLMAHGADVFVQDSNGRTTLDLAGENGFADIAALLVQNYPDLIPIAGV